MACKHINYLKFVVRSVLTLGFGISVHLETTHNFVDISSEVCECNQCNEDIFVIFYSDVPVMHLTDLPWQLALMKFCKEETSFI